MILATVLEDLPRWIALPALAGLSGLIAASETALFSLSRQQLAVLRQSGRRGVRHIIRLREDPRALLSTLLLANISINILLYSVLTVTLRRLAGDHSATAGVLSVVGFLVILLFAEMAPKLIVLPIGDRLAPVVAGPLLALRAVTAPVRWVLDLLFVEPLTRLIAGPRNDDPGVRPDELQEFVNMAQEQGLVDERESALLHRAIDLGQLRVRALMVPRVDVIAFDLKDDPRRLVQLFCAHRLLRIPVYERSIDKILGVVHAREFLTNPDRPIRELIRPVHFVPEQARVEGLLEHLRRAGTHLALVVDEYGGLAGIIALEDVVEAVVGELYAVGEAAPRPVERVGDREYLVLGGLDLDDLRRAFDLAIDEKRVHTVGGFLAAELERLPVLGDSVRIGNAVLTVTAMKGHRVLRARLVMDDPIEETPDLLRLLEVEPSPHRHGRLE